METTVREVHKALANGERVLLLTRHAERPHIDPEDPTFGEDLPITEAGERMAVEYGRMLRTSADVQFMASPLRRTRLTAAKIAEGMGLADKWNFDTIPTDALIGNASHYYADPRKVWEIFRGGEFYRLSFEYCRTGEQTGFRPLHAAAEMHEAHVLANFTAQLGIFTSHDLFIAAFLSARGVYSGWKVDTWVQYLDSAAIIIAPDGARRYAFVRRDGAAAPGAPHPIG